VQRRKLGQAETSVSAIGYGAMSLTHFYGPIDADESDIVLRKVLDLGIDHIDTSNVYGAGLSEERIGAFLAKQGQQKDNTFKIATKAGITRNDDGERVFDNSAAHLGESLDKSLKRMGVDHVELFYVHRREAARPIEEVTETLAGFIKAGKIRQFGFSEIAPTSLAVAHSVHPVGAVQSEYSLSTRSPEMGLVQRTAELGTSLVAFCPVGRSLLTDTPHDFEKSQNIDFLKSNPRFLEPNLSRNIEATVAFRALAKDMGTSAAALAMAWLLHQGEHILPIPGTRSVEHLEQLAAGAELKLTPTNLADIDRVLPIGWAHGDRYNVGQWNGPEKYC